MQDPASILAPAGTPEYPLDPDRLPWVRWRRILHPDPKVFAGLLSLPAHSLAERVLHPDSPCNRAVFDTIPAEPTLVRIQHNGRLSLFRIGDENVRAAYFHALMTGCAQLGIDDDAFAGRHRISNQVGFRNFHVRDLPVSLKDRSASCNSRRRSVRSAAEASS
jgi:hypothetical protein